MLIIYTKTYANMLVGKALYIAVSPNVLHIHCNIKPGHKCNVIFPICRCYCVLIGKINVGADVVSKESALEALKIWINEHPNIDK